MNNFQFKNYSFRKFFHSISCCVIFLTTAVSTIAFSGETRYIHSMKGGGAIAYFQDAEPNSTVWVYKTSGKGTVGYFEKGQANTITYIYQLNGESPLFFTETNSVFIYIYTVGKPGVWGYFSK